MSYFSLNRWMENEQAVAMASLQKAVGMHQLAATSEPASMVKHTNLDHWISYGGILLGILLQRLSSAGYQLDPSKFTWPVLIGSVVLSFAVYPQLSNKARFSKNTPFLVRFGTSIQNGIFWPAIMEGIGKSFSAGS